MAGSPTVTATNGGLTSATQQETINPAAASKLVFTTTAVTVTAGVASGTITVQRQDQYNNPNTSDGTIAVNLTTSSSGGSFLSTNGVTAITSTNIVNGSSTASFSYQDTVAGSPTITNAATGLTSATQQETVVPAAASKLVFTTSPVTVTAGVASGTITVQRQDAFNNPATNGTATVNLTSSSAGGSFTNASGTTAITSTNILSNASTASFLYRDTVAGNPTVSATNSVLASGTQVETVTPAAANKLVVKSEPGATATAGVAFNPQPAIYVEDQFGNVATNDSSTVTAALASGTGPLQGTTNVAAVSGVVTFNTLADNMAESIKLKYTDGGSDAGDEHHNDRGQPGGGEQAGDYFDGGDGDGGRGLHQHHGAATGPV